MLEMALLLAVGMLTGLLAGLFGIGGGTLMVPALYILYPNIPAEMVTATSLAVIFLNCFFIVLQFLRQGLNLPLKNMATLFASCLSGGLIGPHFMNYLAGEFLKRFFVIMVLMSVALGMFKNESPHTSDEISWQRLMLFGILTGLLGSLTGLGGSFVLIPCLIYLSNLTITLHSPYTNIGMVGTTLGGVVGHALAEKVPFIVGNIPNYSLGHIHLTLALTLFAGTTLTSPLAVRLNPQMSRGTKKIILGILLTLLMVRVWWSTL